MNGRASIELSDLLSRSARYRLANQSVRESLAGTLASCRETCEATFAAALALQDVIDRSRALFPSTVQDPTQCGPSELLRRVALQLRCHRLQGLETKTSVRLLTQIVMTWNPGVTRLQALDIVEFAVRKILGNRPWVEKGGS